MSDTNRYWHIYQSTKHYDKRGLSDKLNPLPRSGWVSVCATEFNIHSTFCPHKSFVLRMDLWTNCNLFQYTILTSFITETKCVYCAVQFQYFNIIYVQKVVLVTRLTAEAQVRSHGLCGICISQNGCGNGIAISSFFAIPTALVSPIVLSYHEGYTTEALERVDK